MKEKILQLLKSNTTDFISGEKISNKLGVSRATIWKYINSLKKEGYTIESVSRKGYKLLSSPDILNYEELKTHLTSKYMGRNVFYYDTIGSTNTKAKELAANGVPEGTVVISEEQTSGRGRLGRAWISPKYKGVWMSIVLRPDIDPMNVAKITQVGAAAVYNAIKSLGIDTSIKWPNDIILNHKKVCGILTEMNAEINKINYVIMGIGINVNLDKEDILDDINSVATSLKIESNNSIDRKKLVSSLLNNFEALYEDFLDNPKMKKTIDICKVHSAIIGKEIRVIKRDSTLNAKAIDINEDGKLVVQYKDGSKEALFSGEVSVRGLMGYV